MHAERIAFSFFLFFLFHLRKSLVVKEATMCICRKFSILFPCTRFFSLSLSRVLFPALSTATNIRTRMSVHTYTIVLCLVRVLFFIYVNQKLFSSSPFYVRVCVREHPVSGERERERGKKYQQDDNEDSDWRAELY